MRHLDLFSGIGGFSWAVDQVWDDAEHVFCEIDTYCQEILKLRWPGSTLYGDIRDLIADTDSDGRYGRQASKQGEHHEGTDREKTREESMEYDPGLRELREQTDIVTGGFPCQPFSQAGRRGGTTDNRYLWPEMFTVIQRSEPTWVVAENVYGLVTWNEGMVLEQVCTDLEEAGYGVQPLIIPAVSKNAPHRRDRVWIIANRKSERDGGSPGKERGVQQRQLEQEEQEGSQVRSQSKRRFSEWERNWIDVATELCRVDDGTAARMDGLKLSKAKHRVHRLKALGNAIVPQVAEEIFRAIRYADPG